MVAELTALRDQIDEVDKALLDLLAKRLHLVAEVGEVKSRHGLPVYVPEREAAMLASRRQEAENLGVPPDLIEDVLRRVMRESYVSENDKGFKTLCPQLRPIVIIGGNGQMGRLFNRSLTLSGYQVRVLDQEDWPQAEQLLADAGMVIVSVPIHVTEQVISRLPTLPDDCILVDLASVKNRPLHAMLAVHSGPVVGLHPMFGPDVGSVAKQVVVYCDGRRPEAYQWLLEQLQVWGRGCIASARSNTIRTWRLFRRCGTSPPSPTGCIWRKRTCNWSSCWRSPRRSTGWSWRWLAACLRRIRSCTPTSLCRLRKTWR